jgi:hypothetical protein
MANTSDMHRTRNARTVSSKQSVELKRRTICGNPECAGRWLALLKDRRRPMFEGRWGCSAHCIKTLVTNAIQREGESQPTSTEERTHRHRMPLGLILLERGWISSVQLDRALEMQRDGTMRPIGYWLTAECGVDKEQVTRALALQWGCPALNIDDFDAKAMALVAPRSLVEAYGIVPIRMTAGRLYLAFSERPDAAAAFAISRMAGIRAENVIVDSTDWAAAHDRLRSYDFINEILMSVCDHEELGRTVSSTLVGLQPRASRLIRLRQFYWLRLWLEAGAMTSTEGGVPRTSEDVVDWVYTVGREQ